MLGVQLADAIRFDNVDAVSDDGHVGILTERIRTAAT
jgi:hypothetical protein